MSSSLVSFLERRKKSAVKSSTVLQKSEDQSDDDQQEKNQEDQEVQSEQDNEWRLSSDESEDGRKGTTTFGPNLSKIIQTIDNKEADELSKEAKEKRNQPIWVIKEPKEEVEEKPAKPKIWVPKYKENRNLLNSKNDVDLAESVKMFTHKNENTTTKKKKKPKQKSNEQALEEEFDFVKVKFDIFSLLDPKYAVFNTDKHTVDEKLVKSKYINRKAETLETN